MIGVYAPISSIREALDGAIDDNPPLTPAAPLLALLIADISPPGGQMTRPSPLSPPCS